MNYLKVLRKKENLTQKEMANAIGCSYSHYVKVEGSFSNPSIVFLRKLKSAFPNADMNEAIKKDPSTD